MKSIKPGRGPSALNVWGSIIAVIIGVFWTITAASMGAPVIFPVFGVLFILTGIISGLYHYRNATGKSRYSSFDITEDGEEPDPLETRFSDREGTAPEAGQAGYCPYCGAPAEAEYAYCRNCGKKLP